MIFPEISEQIAIPFQALGSPARIAILIAIGRGEACVCHLETILGWRQAYISQHLMALRKAELIQDRRQGKYVYYHLTNESILTLVKDVGRLSGVAPDVVESLVNSNPGPDCECPLCTQSQIHLESPKNQ